MFSQLAPVWLAFFFAAATPGPAQVFVIEKSSLESIQKGRWAALGVSLGSALWVVGVLFGVNQLMARFDWAPQFLRLLSIALLSYFLIRNLNFLARNFFSSRLAYAAAGAPSRKVYSLKNESPSELITKGCMINIFNPNSLVFYLSLFAPLMVNEHNQSALLFCLFGVSLLSLAWYQFIAYVGGHPRLQRRLRENENKMRSGFCLLYAYFLVKISISL